MANNIVIAFISNRDILDVLHTLHVLSKLSLEYLVSLETLGSPLEFKRNNNIVVGEYNAWQQFVKMN